MCLFQGMHSRWRSLVFRSSQPRCQRCNLGWYCWCDPPKGMGMRVTETTDKEMAHTCNSAPHTRSPGQLVRIPVTMAMRSEPTI